MSGKNPMSTGTGVMKQFSQYNQEIIMEQAIENKLKEEHSKRVEANQDAEDLYDALVNEKGDQDEGERDSMEDEDMDGEEAEIMRRMAESRMQKVHYDDGRTREERKRQGNVGEFLEVTEEEFFHIVTKNTFAVCHFNHKDFNRCKIAEHHLRKVAHDHPECKFLQIDVVKSPFLVEKLLVVVLPTICMFKDGVKIDEINGFDDLGGKDEFETVALTRRLAMSKVITLRDEEKFTVTQVKKKVHANDSDSDSED